MKRKSDVKKQVEDRRNESARDFLTRLTDSYDVDDELEELFWAYSSKDVVLSNLSQKEVRELMEGFHGTINDYIMQQPEHEFTWQESMAINQFEDWLKLRLNRSLDGFERKMETTETNVQRQVLEGMGEEEGGGVMEKFKGLIGKGGGKEAERKRRVQMP